MKRTARSYQAKRSDILHTIHNNDCMGRCVLTMSQGISLSMEQFNALLTVLPQMTAYLEGQDIEVVHPASMASKAAKPKEEDVGVDSEDKLPTAEQPEAGAMGDAEDTDQLQ